MKYYAASLLAVATAALKLKQGCPEKPDSATPEDVFALLDTDDSGALDDAERMQGLACLVEWGIYEQEEA